MGGIGQKDLVSHLRSQFEALRRHPWYTFLVESRRDLVEDVATFRELDRSAREIAAWLATRPEADRPVLLLFEPGVNFWRAFLGCLYAGVVAIPAPLPHDQRSMGRVAGILRDADSNLALTTTKLHDLLAAGIEELGIERPILCVAIDDSPLADADAWTLPGHHRRQCGLPAVHIRLDRRPQGRRCHPRQRAEQRGHDLRSHFGERRLGARRLDPPLPRHGSHQRGAGVLRRSEPRRQCRR